MKLPRILSDAELDEKFADRRAKRRALRKASYEKWSNGPKGEAYRRAQKAKKTRSKK